MSGTEITRARLLRGQFKPATAPARPPWSLGESDFLVTCAGSECARCISVCPENIIRLGKRARPEIDFRVGECTFCRACADSCPEGALDPTKDQPWTLTADIGVRCLGLKGVTCRVCGDACEPEAITFRLATGGIALPMVDATACTGCGACVGPCPVDAISVQEGSKQ